ncbi:MAG: hypothetical protein HDR22_02490 [Lachnospiraceae bacterium]|nr:hypothetical protein [Lachnospiraceae bacterium]
MKKKTFQILLCGNLLILFPSILDELVRYNIINYKYAWSIMSPNWFVINAIYGLLFSIPAMILISISTLIVIEKEHKKGNIIKQNLFIWLTLWLLNAIAILSSFDIAMLIARQ